jgi:SOS-response transcriptional repressor LexA
MNIHGRSHEALDFIRGYVLTHNCSPTVREVAAAVGSKSVSDAHRLIAHLVDAGKLTKRPGRQRALKLIPQSPILPLELPLHLYDEVQSLASKANVTPQAVVIEAVRDGILGYYQRFCSNPVPTSAHVKPDAGRAA